MKVLNCIVLVLVVLGALNWGLTGLFNFDFVAMFFGTMTTMTRIIYSIIGIAGLWALTFFGRIAIDD